MNNEPAGMESKIIAVTVFSDRAQVSRSGKTALDKGENFLLFDLLPESLDENSIQVSGKGNALIKDVRLKQVFFSQVPDQRMNQLLQEKSNWQEKKDQLDDILNRVKGERKFIQDIVTKLTETSNEKKNLELDPEKWMKMAEFYRTRLDALNQENREKNKDLKQVEREISRLEQEINFIHTSGNKTRNQVEVLVDAREAADAELILSYMVYGPSWKPVYDLRVSSHTKKMNIGYNAIIEQNTTEDWTGINLKLSTARPQVSGFEEELKPWRLYEKLPPPPPLYPAAQVAYSSGIGAKMSPSALERSVRSEDEKMDMAEEMAAEEQEPAMETEGADVETGSSSVVFNIPGTISIESDNKPHRVTVMLFDFPAIFQYSTTPKLAQLAYLKARVKNESDFPFLPGVSNVFFDNSFVANSKMDLVSPAEEFWTYLGIDEAMKVERKFIRKYHSKEGVFTKTNKYIFEYKILITNNKKTEEEILIRDQIPISGQEKIVVSLLEPIYKQDTDTLKLSELKVLEWSGKIKPGEKMELPFKFSVEYPKDMRISGLSQA